MFSGFMAIYGYCNKFMLPIRNIAGFKRMFFVGCLMVFGFVLMFQIPLDDIKLGTTGIVFLGIFDK